MKDKVSVVVIVYNEEGYIGNCLKALVNQTYKNIEIIIVDDFSSDNTPNEIKKIRDKRIIYHKNSKNLGYSKSRNVGIKLCKGKYLFFIDGDCIPNKNWVEQGLKVFRLNKCLGIEGKINYVSKNYKPTFVDKKAENQDGGQYMGGNLAYRREVFDIVGFFNPSYLALEDLDFALRVLKIGKMIFSDRMVVNHQKKEYSILEFIKTGKRESCVVKIFKDHGYKDQIFWRIFAPDRLITIFFPPLLFFSFLRNRYRSFDDFKLFPFIYPQLLYERYWIWKRSFSEKVFII